MCKHFFGHPPRLDEDVLSQLDEALLMSLAGIEMVDIHHVFFTELSNDPCEKNTMRPTRMGNPSGKTLQEIMK